MRPVAGRCRYHEGMERPGPKPPPSPGWTAEYDENGVDLTLLRANLKLTPEERIRRADVMRRQALQLRAIGEEHRKNALRRDR